MDALITYGGDRVGYSAMRSLTSSGARVVIADPAEAGMSQWSRFCWRKYRLSNGLKRPEAFVDEISRILNDSKAGFLLPAHDETETLARYRDRLPDRVILPLTSYENIHMANNKMRTAVYAESVGVCTPELIEWTSLEELEGKLQATGCPVVIKLRSGSSARWVFYPESTAEAVDICRELSTMHHLSRPDMQPIVQRRVEGEGWGVSCLYHEGRKIASFTHRRLRQFPETGGASTLRISARNEKLEAYAEKLLDGLGWHGIAMAEFKYNPLTKDAWFIEINPRLWGSINLAVASGVDLVSLLYVASTEGPETARKIAGPQREGVTARWWLGDARLAFTELKRMKLLKSLKLLMPFGADCCDELRVDDPGATLGAIARPVVRYLRGSGQGTAS